MILKILIGKNGKFFVNQWIFPLKPYFIIKIQGTCKKSWPYRVYLIIRGLKHFWVSAEKPLFCLVPLIFSLKFLKMKRKPVLAKYFFYQTRFVALLRLSGIPLFMSFALYFQTNFYRRKVNIILPNLSYHTRF